MCIAAVHLLSDSHHPLQTVLCEAGRFPFVLVWYSRDDRKLRLLPLPEKRRSLQRQDWGILYKKYFLCQVFWLHFLLPVQSVYRR